MSATELRQEIRQAMKNLPVDRLATLADFARFLQQAKLRELINEGERSIAAGKGVSWRKLKKNV